MDFSLQAAQGDQWDIWIPHFQVYGQPGGVEFCAQIFWKNLVSAGLGDDNFYRGGHASLPGQGGCFCGVLGRYFMCRGVCVPDAANHSYRKSVEKDIWMIFLLKFSCFCAEIKNS